MLVARLGLLLALALGLRLLYFTGLALGDDVFYATQSLACSRGEWPPQPYHWNTRLGIVGPTALSVLCLGPRPAAFVLWPLALSTLNVLVCFFLAWDLTDRRTAWLAALFQAAFPLEVIYATHLFPDVAVSLFSTLSIWCWIRGLRDDRGRDYFLSGLFFGAGYLCRETVFMDGPVYLALWALYGRIRRPRVAWAFVAPVLVLAGECALYAQTAGTPLYRWKAILAQQRDPGNLELVRTSVSGGGFLTDPLIMLAARQEFGLYHLAAVVAGLLAFRRRRELRPLVLWLIVGFVWTYYGTTVPTGWVVLQRDPRYAAALTAPSVIILAHLLMALRPGWRYALAALLIGSGLFCAGLDQGNTILRPHADFTRSHYAAGAALEPFEYVGARWELGLDQPPWFSCASDRGRASVVRLVRVLGATTLAPSSEVRFFVFSPQRRPDLPAQLKAQGWVEVADFPGRATPSRAAVAQLLALISSQRGRAERILHPPGLVVLEKAKRPAAAP
jgi:hypothetical protein